MSTITIGVDLAKSVFSVCAVDAAGHVQRRQDLGREAHLRCGWRRCRPVRWWRGSLQWRASLGTAISGLRLAAAADGGAVRHAVPQQPHGEERPQRCRGHCHRRAPGRHALRAGGRMSTNKRDCREAGCAKVTR